MATIVENRKAVEDILPQYLLDEFIDWINKYMEPEDVFDKGKLDLWSLNNGYIKDE